VAGSVRPLPMPRAAGGGAVSAATLVAPESGIRLETLLIGIQKFPVFCETINLSFRIARWVYTLGY
jgi:hypothetical protein